MQMATIIAERKFIIFVISDVCQGRKASVCKI